MKTKLQALSAQLLQSPERVAPVDKCLVQKIWRQMRAVDLDQQDHVGLAIIIAVILYDGELLAPLLDPEDLTQLETIAKRALERYHQCINPPKPVGLALAAALKGIET